MILSQVREVFWGGRVALSRRSKTSVRGFGPFVMILAMATQIFGACGDDPSNLLRFSNCGFDSSTSGWTLANEDVLDHDPAEGYSELGAALIELTFYPPNNRYEARFQGPCVPLRNLTEYDSGAHMKAFGGMTCGVTLVEYSGASCTTFVHGCGGLVQSSDGSWVLVDRRCTTASTAQSGRLDFTCWDASSFQAVLDDAFIKVAPFFADGFESGSTSAWSVIVP